MKSLIYCHFFGVVILSGVLITACSDSDSLPDVPEAPSFEPINVTDEYIALDNISSSADSSNHAFLQALPLIEETLLLYRVFELSSEVFEFTQQIDPEFENGVFTWIIRREDLGFPETDSPNLEWIVTADVTENTPGSAKWEAIQISPFIGIDERIVLKGENFNSGSSGEWISDEFILPATDFGIILFQMNDNPDPELVRELTENSPLTRKRVRDLSISWERAGDSERSIRAEFKESIEGFPSSNVTLSDVSWLLEQSGPELRFDLVNVGEEGRIGIFLNMGSNAGYLDKEGSERKCWNESFEDVEC